MGSGGGGAGGLDNRAVSRSGARRLGVAGVAVFAIAAAVLVLRAAGVVAPRSLIARGVLDARDPVLVADFVTLSGDSTLAPVVTEALRTDLSQSRVVALAQPTLVQETLRRMQRNEGAPTRLDEATAREVAQRAGIKAVVVGDIGRAGPGWVISARLVAPDSGTVYAAARETAADSTALLRAIDRLSKTLRGRVGESVRAMRANPPLDQVTTSSLEALRLFSQGEKRDFTTLDEAIRLYKRAVSVDTAFAAAYRSLGVYENLRGNAEGVRWALERAYRHRDRLTAYERSMTEATYLRLVEKDLDAAHAAYEQAATLRPEDWRALENIAWGHVQRGEWERAETAFRRTIALDSSLWWNYNALAWLQLGRGDVAGSAATNDLTRRRFPQFDKEPDIQWERFVYAWILGADSVARLGQRLTERHIEWRAGVAERQGRMADASRDLAEWERRAGPAASAFDRLERGLIRAHLEVARGQATNAVRIADGVAPLVAEVAELGAERPHHGLAVVYARAGRPDKARSVLARFDRVATPGWRRAVRMHQHRVTAFIAMAEGRPADAIPEFIAWYQTPGCFMCAGHPELGRAYELTGQPDSAIAVYEAFLHTPSVTRLSNPKGIPEAGYDQVWEAPVLERLARLYERKGERAKAAGAYAAFVETWRHADAALQPRVARARARIAALR